MCFPRGLLGLGLGEKWGDLIHSFIQQIFIEHLLCAGLSEWLLWGLWGGEESVTQNVLDVWRRLEFCPGPCWGSIYI